MGGVELELTEDQAFLLDTTRRFLDANAAMPTVRALEEDPAGFSEAYWRQGAELGWTSMLVPEALGGGSLSEHGLLDLVLVAEEMGRHVAPGPLAPVNIVASEIARAGTAEQREAVLPSLLDGSAIAAWCGCSPVEATADGEGWVLSGSVPAVEAAAQAEHLLVAATTGSEVVQLLVPAATPGVTVTPLAGLDLVRRHAAVTFAGARLPRDAAVGSTDDGCGELERSLQVACVLQCAETCGVIDVVFAMTLEYLGDRYSFGRPLSSYQALKHRLADDKVVLESCHAAASAAARAVATSSTQAAELVSVAKSWIGPHATELIQDCVQLHGGIGVTWEHDLHLYLRRATGNRVLHGTPEWHADRIAGALLAVGQ
jgi:alkylation response protein AidB-like acyl-CoA dehydrogenase